MSLTSQLSRFFFGKKETTPPKAYDLWAAGYDAQPGNLMLDMDEELFTSLLDQTIVYDKWVADIGCGTGRHWKKIIQKNPARLVGYDVSRGMLDKLKQKFPGADTHVIKDHLLPGLENNSCDLIISTLAIAHIPSLEKALLEWNRVLKQGGEIIITDYHPEALAKGGKRTFRHEGRWVAVKNYIHPVEKLRLLAKQLQFEELRFTERVIDDSVKGYYERQNALRLFEQFKDVPIIYGIHLRKHGPV